MAWSETQTNKHCKNNSFILTPNLTHVIPHRIQTNVCESKGVIGSTFPPNHILNMDEKDK